MTSFHGHLRKWNVWSHFRLQDFKASDVEVDHIIIIVVVANLFFFIRSSYCFKEKGIKPTNVLSPMIPLSGKRLHRNTSEMLQLEEIRGIESKSDESKEQKKKSFFFEQRSRSFLPEKKEINVEGVERSFWGKRRREVSSHSLPVRFFIRSFVWTIPLLVLLTSILGTSLLTAFKWIPSQLISVRDTFLILLCLTCVISWNSSIKERGAHAVHLLGEAIFVKKRKGHERRHHPRGSKRYML